MPLPISAVAIRANRGVTKNPTRVLLLALLGWLGLVGALEGNWRALGLRPTVPDSKDLWYFWRQQADCDSRKVIVFLGSSRITADISIDTLRDCLPQHHVVQLGLSGAESCIGLLRDLVADPHFKGTVVCELDTPLLERSLWDGHLDYRTYRPVSSSSLFEELAWAWLADRLAVLQHPLSIWELIGRFVDGTPPPVGSKLRFRFSREIQWDFAMVPDIETLRRQTTEEYRQRYKEHRFPGWDELTKDLKPINSMVKCLQERGGQVVFLRVPSTGDRWRLEEQFHAKEANWDRLAASTDAICIHFKELPAASALQCPDESHLDYRDAPLFTRAFATEVTRRGWK